MDVPLVVSGCLVVLGEAGVVSLLFVVVEEADESDDEGVEVVRAVNKNKQTQRSPDERNEILLSVCVCQLNSFKLRV